MHEKSDAQLLRDYAAGGEDAAFRGLVSRYTDFVFSAALRQVNCADSAADITQGVFVDLARKADALGGELPPDASLAGWLHRATRYAVLNHHRATRRRALNERQAMEQLLTDTEPSPEWDQIRPVLDEALDSLDETDREAVLLRYFQKRDFRAVGLALGVSDDAAQKRVSRAVEQLRTFFSRRNISVGAAALALLLSTHGVQAAPVSLATAASTAALAATGTVAAPPALVVAKAAGWTLFQKALLTSTAVTLAGFGLYEARQAGALREKVRALELQQAALEQQLRPSQPASLASAPTAVPNDPPAGPTGTVQLRFPGAGQPAPSGGGAAQAQPAIPGSLAAHGGFAQAQSGGAFAGGAGGVAFGGAVTGGGLSLATKTVNGETVIVYRGQEFPVGRTQGTISTKAASVQGKDYAAAFDGERVIWENLPGAAQHVK